MSEIKKLNLRINLSKDGLLSIWDVRMEPTSVGVLTENRGCVRSINFIKENILISSTDDKTIRIFDTRMNKCIETIPVRIFFFNCRS